MEKQGSGFLVLTRKVGQEVSIGLDTKITVSALRHGTVTLVVQTEPNLKVRFEGASMPMPPAKMLTIKMKEYEVLLIGPDTKLAINKIKGESEVRIAFKTNPNVEITRPDRVVRERRV